MYFVQPLKIQYTLKARISQKFYRKTMIMACLTNLKNTFIERIAQLSMSDASGTLVKLIRLFYIGVALYYVSYGYYTTILLANEGNLKVKDEVSVLQRYRYPSLTFCYVFKSGKTGEADKSENGGKDVWMLYYRHLIEKWRKTGKLSFFNLLV